MEAPEGLQGAGKGLGSKGSTVILHCDPPQVLEAEPCNFRAANVGKTTAGATEQTETRG